YEFSLDNCPSLYGKPKIFIVQACQGSLSQSETGTVAPPVNPASFVFQNVSGGLESSPSTVQWTNMDVKHTYSAKQLKQMNILDYYPGRNPPLMDFITINATLPGFLCYRLNKGSFFIQSLCEALSQEYLDKIPDEGTQHLEDLLRCVQDKINAYSDGRQTMPWEVCLSKHIRFRKV
ncbi:Uncharacterized protein APZ42_000639, partial [Daphnia magna]